MATPPEPIQTVPPNGHQLFKYLCVLLTNDFPLHTVGRQAANNLAALLLEVVLLLQEGSTFTTCSLLCLSEFCCCDEMSNTNHLRKKGLNFTHGFKWLSPSDRRARWSSAASLAVASKQVRECPAGGLFFLLFHSSRLPA